MGLPYEAHQDLGRRLFELRYSIRGFIGCLKTTSRPYRVSRASLRWIDKLRSLLDEQHYRDQPWGVARSATYYPPVSIDDEFPPVGDALRALAPWVNNLELVYDGDEPEYRKLTGTLMKTRRWLQELWGSLEVLETEQAR